MCVMPAALIYPVQILILLLTPPPPFFPLADMQRRVRRTTKPLEQRLRPRPRELVPLLWS